MASNVKDHYKKNRALIERNWVHRLLSRGTATFYESAASIGALSFIVTLSAAGLLSDGKSLLDSQPLYLFTLAVAWVIGCVYWGLAKLTERIKGLDACFEQHDFEKWSDRWIRNFASNRGMFLSALFVFLLCAAIAVTGMFFETNAAQSRHFFPSSFYVGNLYSHLTVILLLMLWVSLAGGSGLWLFIVNIPFILSLRRLRVRPLPKIVATKFRLFTDFYLVSCGAWFVGVGITAAILLQNFSEVSKIVLIVASLIGSSAFLGPQIVFHHLLLQANDQVAEDVLRLMGRGIASRKLESMEELQKVIELDGLVAAGSTWIIDGNDMILRALGNLFPSLIIYVKLVTKLGG